MVSISYKEFSEEEFTILEKFRKKKERKRALYLINFISYYSSGGGGTRTSLFPFVAIGLTIPAASIVSINLAALL